MKVSIIGAGLSGLSCAHRLVQLGVTPRIYEEDESVGNFHPVGEALLEMLYRPIEDPIMALSSQYDLYLHPQQTVTRMEVFAPHAHAVLEGFQGFVVMRGDHEDSLEKQLARQIDVPIEYGPTDLRRIARDSDYVVVATGDPEMVSQVQPWYTDSSGDVAVATVRGDFTPQQLTTWFGHDFAPKGYGFMLPWAKHEATLAVVIPRQAGDVEALWPRFLGKLRFDFEVTDFITVRNFQSGHIEKSQIGNMLFIGNAGGALMPFMGFGNWDAILSGIWAAEAIVNKQDFNQRMQPIRRGYRRSLGMRRLFSGLSDASLDRLVGLLSSSAGQYVLIRSRLNLLRVAGILASLGVRDT